MEYAFGMEFAITFVGYKQKTFKDRFYVWKCENKPMKRGSNKSINKIYIV